MKKTLLTVILFWACSMLSAQNIWLPTPWGDNAVLKQNSEVSIRGWAYPAATVEIVPSWNTSDTVRVTASNGGIFTATLKTPQGSYQPQTIYFNGVPLMQNVLIGEVWICSGQSNMQWSVNHGIADGEKHASQASNNNIRIFSMPLHGAETPQENVRGEWQLCSPETMRRTSAVGYFFASELEKTLGVPVGIMVNAWGGAVAESYAPAEQVYGNVELAANTVFVDNPWHDDRPGKIFNAMVAPLAPYTVSGVIWYQGESNIKKWGVYNILMEELVKGWRETFGQQMPFYMAQIAPFNYGDEGVNSPSLRIMQERASRDIENSGLVVVSDLVNDVNNIHPTDKLSVGRRFANLALAKTYGKSTVYQYPLFKQATTLKNGRVIVEFDNLVGGLKTNDGKKEVSGLKIVDNQGQAHNAIGVIKGDKLEVSAKGVKEVKAVWYCYDNTTIGNLASGEGLPAAPFNSELNRK